MYETYEDKVHVTSVFSSLLHLWCLMTSNSRWMKSPPLHIRWKSELQLKLSGKSLQCQGKMDSLVHYINPVHISSLLSLLNEQRLNGQLCDVIIIVGDHKFQAHRSVLAASSEYFQTIFNSGNTQGQSVVQLDFCDPEVFENVLNYIYSSSLFVNKGYLAAVQELGCSLGIQFLNNIMEKKPQVSYIVSKKKMLSEGNECNFTSRNVIAGQNHSDNPGNSFPHIEAIHLHGKTPSEHTIRKQTVLPIGESKQLSVSSSVSLIDLQIQHKQLPSDTTSLSDNPQLTDCKEANRNQKFRQTDGVGYLFKTPLAKSLSIDNPVCTNVFHLDKRKKRESPEESPNIEATDQLGDLSDVIQVTVGDDLPVDVRNLTVSFDEPKEIPMNEEDEQRKARLCSESSSLKKPNGVNEHSFSSEGARPSITADKANNDMQLKRNRIFKCRNCLKVFRSSTGLYRHINMFHNLEKPYACDICNKRFHTNFKVWTHCQTQHGVLQDPAPTSSYTGMDDRLYRKSASLVQERELKKRLWGLKSGSLQSQINHKYHLRSRSIINTCPQCGNTYRLLSQFKRHLMLHHCVKSEILNDVKEELPQANDHGLHSQKDKNQDVSSCSVCSEKFCAKYEQGGHEQRCQPSKCPHCGPFDSFKKKQTETHCEYENLACHECKRTFQSTISLWRHQVEVHSQNLETRKEPVSVYHQDHNNDAASGMKGCGSGENVDFDSSKPVIFLPESSSIPKTESLHSLQEEIKVEEEPSKENIDNSCSHGPKTLESSQWSCEKCGRHFSGCKQLERHQELLCYIKPFICHICQKSFRTNFRLWSHIQSHTPNSESASKKRKKDFSSHSPSLPLPSEITESVSVAMGRKTEENAAGELLHSGILCDTLSPSKQSDQVSNHAPAPSSSKRQHICKLCRRNFKTAFSLWSHEQSHSNH